MIISFFCDSMTASRSFTRENSSWDTLRDRGFAVKTESEVGFLIMQKQNILINQIPESSSLITSHHIMSRLLSTIYPLPCFFPPLNSPINEIPAINIARTFLDEHQCPCTFWLIIHGFPRISDSLLRMALSVL